MRCKATRRRHKSVAMRLCCKGDRKATKEQGYLTVHCLSNKEAPGRCVRLETSQNGKTFLARRWSSVCVCVCLRGFVRLRSLLVGPGVVVLSRSLAVLSVQVLWCCLPDLATPVFQRGRRPDDRSTKAATLELPFSGKPFAMKLGSQVVSAGLLVTVRLFYWSLGLSYSVLASTSQPHRVMAVSLHPASLLLFHRLLSFGCLPSHAPVFLPLYLWSSGHGSLIASRVPGHTHVDRQ